MNKLKLITWVLISLMIVNGVFAINLISAEDRKAITGTLGNIGYSFQTIVNWFIYFAFVMAYWFLIILYFLIVYLFIIWLPLRMYPTYVQYYNFLRIMFGSASGTR